MTDIVKSILSYNDKETLRLRVTELEAKETAVVKSIRDEKTKNKIYYFTRPNPPQEDLLNAWADTDLSVFTFTGGNRSGKTTIGCILAICTAIGAFPWNNRKIRFPHRKPRKIRIIGQDWESHIKTVVIPTLKEWWPDKRPFITKKNNVGAEHFWTDEQTGSTIEIMSNNQDADVHEGWNGDLIYYDEPPRREIRVANARGLVDRNGREVFCMTLLKEAWVDQDVIKATLEDGRPDPSIFNVHAEIYDNIGFGLTAEGVDLFAKKLKPEERDARLKGVPSYMSGLICPKFRRETHIKHPPKDIPLDWILDIAIDFHPSKEWAVLFRAIDSRNFHYIIDEIWEHGSWKAIGEKIVRKIKHYGLRVNNIIIDPLAKGDKNSDLHEESVYDKLYDLFSAYGYSLSVACKDKEGGIYTINDLLMTENEMPALFFYDRLRRTIMEIEGWMYDEKGKPVKDTDDMMENLYRLCLLNTIYEEPDDIDESDHQPPVAVNNVTGY